MLVAALLLSVPGSPTRAQTAYEQLQQLTEALNLVRANYVDSVGYGQLTHAAINGILRSLDPHSYFMPAADFELLLAIESGNLTTAGLSLTEADGEIIVLSVLPGGAAGRHGLRAGDRVRAVNDTTTAGQRAFEVELRLSGTERRNVTLTVERGLRAQPDTFRLQFRTETYRNEAVTGVQMLSDGIGYVQLSHFTQNANRELESAVKELRSRHASGIILDLRDNPGGPVASSVDVAGLFLEKDVLVFRTDGRKGETDQAYSTRRRGPFHELSIALLVNRGTASAAEAVAASLQDHGRATIVGRRTYGKALVQAPFLLRSGDVMWLTIARVYSPGGRLLQRDYRGRSPEAYADPSDGEEGTGGIVPDVLVPAMALPAWWTRALAGGAARAVADSVAATLEGTPDARAAWAAAEAEWAERLLIPLLARLEVPRDNAGSAEARATVARMLAARAAEVRWGEDAALALLLRGDADVRAAQAVLRNLLEPSRAARAPR